MSTPTPLALERYHPVMTELEHTTLLGSLAGYRGFTREAYALDLRQFTVWCWQHDQRLFEVRRVDIECFARDLEERDRARATVARRLCTIVGLFRYAEEEGVIEHSPEVHIRRRRNDYESNVAHLDRNELGAHPRRRRAVLATTESALALAVAAGAGQPRARSTAPNTEVVRGQPSAERHLRVHQCQVHQRVLLGRCVAEGSGQGSPGDWRLTYEFWTRCPLRRCGAERDRSMA